MQMNNMLFLTTIYDHTQNISDTKLTQQYVDERSPCLGPPGWDSSGLHLSSSTLQHLPPLHHILMSLDSAGPPQVKPENASRHTEEGRKIKNLHRADNEANIYDDAFIHDSHCVNLRCSKSDDCRALNERLDESTSIRPLIVSVADCRRFLDVGSCASEQLGRLPDVRYSERRPRVQDGRRRLRQTTLRIHLCTHSYVRRRTCTHLISFHLN